MRDYEKFLHEPCGHCKEMGKKNEYRVCATERFPSIAPNRVHAIYGFGLRFPIPNQCKLYFDEQTGNFIFTTPADSIIGAWKKGDGEAKLKMFVDIGNYLGEKQESRDRQLGLF
ncbi:MAG: hypothetical protein V1802_00700 [Candidatus Aenigmatarchaeota archaeon]